MCIDVEIDFTEESVASLKVLVEAKLKNVIEDSCSLTILTECEATEFEELSFAVGRAVLNSVLVSAVTTAMDAESENK